MAGAKKREVRQVILDKKYWSLSLTIAMAFVLLTGLPLIFQSLDRTLAADVADLSSADREAEIVSIAQSMRSLNPINVADQTRYATLSARLADLFLDRQFGDRAGNVE